MILEAPTALGLFARMWPLMRGALAEGESVTLKARPEFRAAAEAELGVPDSGQAGFAHPDVKTLPRTPRPSLRVNAAGPVIVHVGANEDGKRLPIDEWMKFAVRMRVQLIRGLHDKMEPQHHRQFAAFGGRTILELAELIATIKRARLFVSADTGPAHLAAQLGVRTLTIFGPTDAVTWSPCGAENATKVIAPVRPTAMSWISADRIDAECRAMLEG